MKKEDYADLVGRISIREVDKKNDHYFTSICPICGFTEDSSVLSSVAVAKSVARSKIVVHLGLAHDIKEDSE